MTGTSYWTLKDGTRHPTGYSAEEFAAPYRAATGAGHEVVVATPGGVVPYVDAMSLRPAMAGSAEIALELEQILLSAEELRRPIELADTRLDEYDAVYYPRGSRPDGGYVEERRIRPPTHRSARLRQALAIVCHAPAAILATRRKGVSPFAGYRVTAYTNDEEDAVGLRVKAPWTVEDELVKLGVEFTRGEIWKPYTVADRNLYTGQNPASAAPLAEQVLAALH